MAQPLPFDRNALSAALGLLATAPLEDRVKIKIVASEFGRPVALQAGIVGVETKLVEADDSPRIEITLTAESEGEAPVYEVERLVELAERMTDGDACEDARVADRIRAALLTGRTDLLEDGRRHPIDAVAALAHWYLPGLFAARKVMAAA